MMMTMTMTMTMIRKSPCRNPNPNRRRSANRSRTRREKFNTYRFADHKEKVIDLLMRVTRVSVETMNIVDAMRMEKR